MSSNFLDVLHNQTGNIKTSCLTLQHLANAFGDTGNHHMQKKLNLIAMEISDSIMDIDSTYGKELRESFQASQRCAADTFKTLVQVAREKSEKNI